MGWVVLEEWAGVDQIPADLAALEEARVAEAAGRAIGKRGFNFCAKLRPALTPRTAASWNSALHSR